MNNKLDNNDLDKRIILPLFSVFFCMFICLVAGYWDGMYWGFERGVKSVKSIDQLLDNMIESSSSLSNEQLDDLKLLCKFIDEQNGKTKKEIVK